jgi:hypothetical protein
MFIPKNFERQFSNNIEIIEIYTNKYSSDSKVLYYALVEMELSSKPSTLSSIPIAISTNKYCGEKKHHDGYIMCFFFHKLECDLKKI